MSAALAKRPPSLPRAASVEPFPPVHFEVLHGRDIEAFEAKVPDTHGGGCSIDGYGRSWVNTTVRDELSVWLADHQSGQQHKIDFGTDYLPMRYGHDVTLLWANGKLCAIANHTTHQLKHPGLNGPLLAGRHVVSGWFHLFLVPPLLFLAGALIWVAIPGAIGVAHGLKGDRLMHHVDEVLDHLASHPIANDPWWAAFFLVMTLALALSPSILIAALSSRNRRYNFCLQRYLERQLQVAEQQWVRQYVPPRAISL